MTSDLLKSYLAPDGMAAAHAAVIDRFAWFLHVSERRYLADIRSTGLEPSYPGGVVPDEVVKKFSSNRIVCFWPIGSHYAIPDRGQPRFIVAVAGTALPSVIGLDWSYGGCWNLADVIRADDPHRPAAQIFSEVIERWGCIVSYNGVHPAALRVWTTDTNRDQPETWPLIGDAEDSDISIF